MGFTVKDHDWLRHRASGSFELWETTFGKTAPFISADRPASADLRSRGELEIICLVKDFHNRRLTPPPSPPPPPLDIRSRPPLNYLMA